MNRPAKCFNDAVNFICLFFLFISQATAQAPKSWTPEAKQFCFHMIGNGHIDPVWLWPWPEGLSVVHSTFRAALDRMNETPDFAFTASSAQFYEWVAENDPEMLAEIRRRVEEGRWSLVGGWWVEPDVNIPGGEALVRQGLYGQLLFRRLFGRIATVGYNPDSFGHAGTLPQILKLQGIENYVFMRPQQHEKKMPADLFWWEGPDGTRLLAYRIPYSYNEEGSVENRLREIAATLREPVKTLMAFYGVGDHGGGATKENIQSILEIQRRPGAPTVIFSTPDRYFQEIRKMPGLELPVVQGDLQHHAVGCYTAESEIKKNNRTAEALLVTGEKLASLASVLCGFPYPKAEFTSSWKKLLFLQFHDSLAGTSLPEHYTAARDAHGYAMECASHAIYTAAQRIAWQVPAEDPSSQYVMVFNPHAWDTTLNVEYDLDWEMPQWPHEPGRKPEARSMLEDERGTSLPHQWTQGSAITGDRRKLVFRAPVPAFGYRQFRVRTAPAAMTPRVLVRAGEDGLENEHLRVTFARNGTVSIFDKDSERQVFRLPAGGARAVVLDDPSDTWSHDIREYSEEIGAFSKATFKVLESGPVRGMVRMRSTYGRSLLRMDWVLYAGSRNLEVRVELDWHEHRKMLKFSFPVDVEESQPTFEVPYGYIARQALGEEDPGQRWIDVSGNRAGRPYGLAIINDAKYGYSVRGNDLRISVARGAVYAHHKPRTLEPDGEYVWQDQGRQTFRLLLVPHAGAWQDAGVVRLAEEFVAPVPVIYQGIHSGRHPLAASFLSVDAPNVVVSAVKKAEEGEDLVVRCYETSGKPAQVTLDLALLHRRWTGSFRPFEIKTLRIPLTGGEIREVNLLEE